MPTRSPGRCQVILQAAVAVLETDAHLPAKIEDKPTKKVKNPFA